MNARTEARREAAIDWAAPVPPGYWRNSRGDLVHEANVRPLDTDMDETVRRIHEYGCALSAQMFRFREHTMLDILEFAERVVESYGSKIGGRRGNITLTTFDGCRKVVLAQADRISVGAETLNKQALIDECLDEWTARAPKNLRALVEQAFAPGPDGTLSASRLLSLRRIVIDDERWRSAGEAISDALRPVGRAEYIRLYRRGNPRRAWTPVPLALSSVRAPTGEPEGDEAAAVLKRSVARAAAEARRRGLSQKDVRAAVAEAVRVRAPAGATE